MTVARAEIEGDKKKAEEKKQAQIVCSAGALSQVFWTGLDWLPDHLVAVMTTETVFECPVCCEDEDEDNYRDYHGDRTPDRETLLSLNTTGRGPILVQTQIGGPMLIFSGLTHYNMVYAMGSRTHYEPESADLGIHDSPFGWAGTQIRLNV